MSPPFFPHFERNEESVYALLIHHLAESQPGFVACARLRVERVRLQGMSGSQVRTAEDLDLPDWVRPVVAACMAVSRRPSTAISSIDVSATLTSGLPTDRRLLCSLLERLAEEHNLEVTLDIEGGSFVARFSSCGLPAGGTHV